MAVLSAFFVAFNVKTGTIIIAISSIILRVIVVIACLVSIINSIYIRPHHAGLLRVKEYGVDSTSVRLLLPDSVLVLWLSCVMLFGILKCRRYYLIPWIVWSSAGTIIALVLWLLYIIFALKDRMVGNLYTLAAAIPIFALRAYAIMCVASQYQEMKGKRKRNATGSLTNS